MPQGHSHPYSYGLDWLGTAVCTCGHRVGSPDSFVVISAPTSCLTVAGPRSAYWRQSKKAHRRQPSSPVNHCIHTCGRISCTAIGKIRVRRRWTFLGNIPLSSVSSFWSLVMHMNILSYAIIFDTPSTVIARPTSPMPFPVPFSMLGVSRFPVDEITCVRLRHALPSHRDVLISIPKPARRQNAMPRSSPGLP